VSRGLQRERDLVNLLREEGWWAIRSPASKGDVDVVAIKTAAYNYRTKVGGVEVRFIEVKSTAAGPYSHFGPADRKELLAAANLAGASAELCWWPPRKKPVFVPSSEWP
jgi:Holliday junction resolvase